MKKLMLLVIAMAFPLLPANATEPGVYYCVIERLVGIQPERDLTEREIRGLDDPFDVPRVAGKFKPNPAHFALKISEVSEAASLCGPISPEHPDITLAWHKAHWPHCDPSAKYKAELPGQIMLLLGAYRPLVWVSGRTFHGKSSMLYFEPPFDQGKGRFQMVGLSAEVGAILSEGTCERFEQ